MGNSVQLRANMAQYSMYMANTVLLGLILCTVLCGQWPDCPDCSNWQFCQFAHFVQIAILVEFHQIGILVVLHNLEGNGQSGQSPYSYWAIWLCTLRICGHILILGLILYTVLYGQWPD